MFPEMKMTEAELLRVIEQAVQEGVTELDLAGQGLTTLPPEIGKLTQLKKLMLGRYIIDEDDNYIASIENSLTELPPEIGQLTALETLDLSGNQLSSLPGEIGQLTALETLSLSGNQLSSLPGEIGQLTALETLSLSGNQLSSLPGEIGQLTALETLDLSGNQLNSLPREIGQLTTLQSLYLSNNPWLSLPAEIGQLSSLQSLYLAYSRLNSLPAEIGQLSLLQTLNLSNNPRLSLPAEIGRLTTLQALVLRGNQLSRLPGEIGQLTTLQALYLSDNQLNSLPAEIGQLTALESLYLSNNQLSSLPVEIGQLTALQSLNLNENELSSLPVEIGQLTALQTLDLFHNQLSSLPVEIGQLTALQTLSLSDNQLSSLPGEIRELPNLKQLDLRRNPLPIPPEILGSKELWEEPGDVAEILDFYFRVQDPNETEPLYEAKLLIVGEGGAGKTSLARKIEDEEYALDPDEDSTQGIEVVRWEFPRPNRQPFRVNIWDFGGQEIYHNTHQFFLTERSLYALVADTRKENTDFYYWLKVVELLSDKSPVLIIKNEKNDRQCQINEGQLKGEFTNLKEVVATNLATNRGLNDIKAELQHYIQRLPHVGQPLPKLWVRVRAALENDSRNYISQEQYFDLCQRNSLSDKKDMLRLSKYLHDLGVCLHFQNDPILKNFVILKPEWATTAVYKVLDNANVRQNQGCFTQDDLSDIWQDDEYAEMRDELLQLMMRFKLCYEIPDRPQTYIAPHLLSPEQPAYNWDETDNLILRYEYEFLPKGILTSFIVEMHKLIEEQTLVWKSGAVLNNGHARAEIIENYPKNEIKIRVSRTHRKELLNIVNHEFFKLHSYFERLQYKTLIPCNCETCRGSQSPHEYSLQTLQEFVSNRQPDIQCQKKPYIMVNVRRLIDDVLDQGAISREERRRDHKEQTEGNHHNIIINAPVEKLVLQQTEKGSNIMTEKHSQRNAAKSSWANGLFYVFLFVVVIAALSFAAGSLPLPTLVLIIVAGLLFVPLIGALQLRQDDRLSEKSFMELVKLVIEQLPLIKNFLPTTNQPPQD